MACYTSIAVTASTCSARKLSKTLDVSLELLAGVPIASIISSSWSNPEERELHNQLVIADLVEVGVWLVLCMQKGSHVAKC